MMQKDIVYIFMRVTCPARHILLDLIILLILTEVTYYDVLIM
jgi:hypothetical protein